MGGEVVAGGGEGGFDFGEEVGGDVVIGDDGGAAFESGGEDARAGFGEEAGGDVDVVRTRAEVDVNGVHE